tara:strand:- start:410 stop:625 length:216 start_codon:yes stop_codon:yes gene_type:complete
MLIPHERRDSVSWLDAKLRQTACKTLRANDRFTKRLDMPLPTLPGDDFSIRMLLGTAKNDVFQDEWSRSGS